MKKRIVTVSLIAVPVIAGLAAYMVQQSGSVSASQTQSPAAIPRTPAAAQPVNTSGVRLHLPRTRQEAPTNKPSQTGDEKSADGPAHVEDIDSASFPRIEHHLLANDSESFADEGSADFSPTGHFPSPLAFVYRGGLGGAFGHRHSNHAGPDVTESRSSVPSNGGTSDSTNVPEQSSQNQSPSNDEHRDAQPSQDESNHSGALADNWSRGPQQGGTSSDTNEHHDDDSKNVPPDAPVIVPIAFNDAPNDRPVQVPEPGTLGLLGLGLLGLARRRKVQR